MYSNGKIFEKFEINNKSLFLENDSERNSINNFVSTSFKFLKKIETL